MLNIILKTFKCRIKQQFTYFTNYRDISFLMSDKTFQRNWIPFRFLNDCILETGAKKVGQFNIKRRIVAINCTKFSRKLVFIDKRKRTKENKGLERKLKLNVENRFLLVLKLLSYQPCIMYMIYIKPF